MKNQNQKFKKIKRSDSLYLSDGYFSNRHWLLKAAWVETMSSRVTFGIRKALKRMQVETVAARLRGESPSHVKLAQFIAKVDFSKYRKVNLDSDSVKRKIGHPRGEVARGLVAFIIKNGKHEIGVDPEYFPMLTFDVATEIFVSLPDSPIVIRRDSEIVGLLMPKTFKERE